MKSQWRLASITFLLILGHCSALPSPQLSAAKDASTCTTPECTEYAKLMLTSLSPKYKSLDPCIDFDAYACDGWRNQHDFQGGQEVVSTTSVLIDANQELLHSVLNRTDGSDAVNNSTKIATDNTNKLRLAFNSCNKENAIKQKGVEALRKLLRDFESVYPLKPSQSPKSPRDELTNALAWLHHHGVDFLIDALVVPGQSTRAGSVISIGSGFEEDDMEMMGIPSPKSSRGKSSSPSLDRAVADMFYTIDTGKSIGSEPMHESKSATYRQKAQRIVNFDELVNSNKPRSPSGFAGFGGKGMAKSSAKTLGQVESMISEVSITGYVKAVAPASANIDENRSVIVENPDWLKTVSQKILAGSDRESLHDYLQWRLVVRWGSHVDKAFTAPIASFLPPANPFTGMGLGRERSDQERWRACLSALDFQLANLVGHVFVNHAFNPSDKALGEQMFKDIQSSMVDAFKSSSWMSPSSGSAAADKATRMKSKIGWQLDPDESDAQKISDYYASLKLGDDYLSNGIAVAKFIKDKTWEGRSPFGDSGVSTTGVDASYESRNNFIEVPAGIMQSPNYHKDLPHYISYGALGGVIGHEMFHGFDASGSRMNADGRYGSWWDRNTTSTFNTRAKCFHNQFAAYNLESPNGKPLHANGRLTFDENAADSAGLKFAYKAWAKRAAIDGDNKLLPGLEAFTKEQLFFLSFGNSWCEKTSKQALAKQVMIDPHAPAALRIIGSVDNSDDFKKAFNCPNKTPKCDLY